MSWGPCYILTCFTGWKETKKVNVPSPGSLSMSSEKQGWPAAELPFPVLVFSLKAWNQNKKWTTHFPYRISFNPHTMPASGVPSASFHRIRNQDARVFPRLAQDQIFSDNKTGCIRALRLQSPVPNLCSQITRPRCIIYLVLTCQEKELRVYPGNLFEGQLVWRVSNTIFLVLFSYCISLICGQTFPSGKII